MTGEVISHFEILDTLGEGGMGVVYRARDTKLDRTVALKLLPSRALPSDIDRERFSLEARSAANLSHPNICTVYEYDEVDGQALIAMECIEGPSLKERIDSGPIPPTEAKRIAKQIAAGLQAAHAKGIVHRDIKPGNVMMTEDGAAKITDFGLAKLIDGTPMTQTGVSVGTVAYMSPEQARGEAVGPASDIWALGAVLFEMLLGRTPFPHNYMAAVLYAIVNEEPTDLDQISDRFGSELGAIVQRCLSKNPAERPTAAELVAMLGGETVAVDLPPVARPTPPAEKSSNPFFRMPVLAGVACAVLLLAGIIFFPSGDSSRVDLAGTTIAILPVSRNAEPGTMAPDSTLRLTLDGLLQTVSGALKTPVSAYAGATIVPFSDALEFAVSDVSDAAGKLGADYVVASRVVGLDPVPTLAISIVGDDGTSIGQPISLPILVTDLQNTYEAALGKIGGLLAVPDSVLERRSSVQASTNAKAFQLYTRGIGLLQQRSSPRSLDAAEDMFQQAVVFDGEFALAHAALGKTDLYRFEVTKDLTRLDEAERHCDEAIRFEPDLIEAYVTLGGILVHTGKVGQAQRALTTALEREPFNTDALVALAEVQEQLGEFSQAEATYKRAVESNPDYWGAYNRLGKFYVGRSQWQKAAEQYQKVVDLAPTNSIGYRNLGAMMWYLGRTDDAQRTWTLALEIEPSYSIYNNLGTMHFFQKNYAAAAAAYERALKINDKDYRVWANLATAYYWMRASPDRFRTAKRKAAEMAERLLAVNPSDLDAKADLAGYYGELGEDEKAKTFLEEFGERPTPDISSGTGFQIGAAWEEVGNRTAALAWIEDALMKGYTINEVMEYPGLDALRTDPAFVRILNSLPVDSTQ